MNNVMMNMVLQTLKAFISAEDAELIAEMVTPENVKDAFDRINKFDDKLNLILENQNKLLGIAYDNSDDNGTDTGSAIAAE